MRRSSPVTAAGPQRIYTVFPILSGRPQARRNTSCRGANVAEQFSPSSSRVVALQRSIHFFTRLQLAKANILPADLVRAGGGGNAVNLQADEAAGVEIVVKIGASDAVDPGTNVVALSHDAIVVPLAVFVGFRGLGLLGKVIHPLRSPGFVPKIAGDTLFRLRNLALIAVHIAGRAHLALFRFKWSVLFIGVTANLHAGIQRLIAQHVELQHEVAIRPAAEERIRAACDRRADDCTVLCFVCRRPSFDGPAVERFAVEERNPAFLAKDGDGKQQQKEQGQNGTRFHGRPFKGMNRQHKGSRPVKAIRLQLTERRRGTGTQRQECPTANRSKFRIRNRSKSPIKTRRMTKLSYSCSCSFLLILCLIVILVLLVSCRLGGEPSACQKNLPGTLTADSSAFKVPGS